MVLFTPTFAFGSRAVHWHVCNLEQAPLSPPRKYWYSKIYAYIVIVSYHARAVCPRLGSMKVIDSLLVIQRESAVLGYMVASSWSESETSLCGVPWRWALHRHESKWVVEYLIHSCNLIHSCTELGGEQDTAKLKKYRTMMSTAIIRPLLPRHKPTGSQKHPRVFSTSRLCCIPTMLEQRRHQCRHEFSQVGRQNNPQNGLLGVHARKPPCQKQLGRRSRNVWMQHRLSMRRTVADANSLQALETYLWTLVTFGSTSESDVSQYFQSRLPY